MIIKLHNNAIRRLEKKYSAEIPVNEYEKRNDVHTTFCNRKDERENNRVSFCPEVNMTEILHHKNYTKEEKSRCWYIKYDYVKTKKKLQRIIQLTNTGELEQQEEDNDEHYSRGLENHLFERAFERKVIREEARKAVLQEQELQRRRQFEEGQEVIKDAAEAIAARCILFSKQCAFEAYNMGLMDEVEAFRISDLKRMNKTTMIINERRKITRHYLLGEKKLRRKAQEYEGQFSFPSFFWQQSEKFQSYLSCIS